MTATRPPIVLTIAGTDPTGGAGIQADLKTFTSLQCYGTSVTTALVAQNTLGVQEVHSPPAAFVAKQLQSLLDDFGVDALKTGMLFNREITAIVVSTLKSHYPAKLPPLVVDPVCVSTSGHTLLQPDALSILRTELLPLATIMTPNISEAELLLSSSQKISSLEHMLSAVKKLSSLGSRAVLLKGGHLIASMSQITALPTSGITVHWSKECLRATESVLILEAPHPGLQQPLDASQPRLVVDVLYQAGVPDEYMLFVRPRLDVTSTHGTGCTLSAALTCELSRGKTVVEATLAATEYTHLAMASSFPLGKGNGPLNHLHPIIHRRLPLPNDSNAQPFVSAMIHASSKTWKPFVQHPFVQKLGEGKLLKENFVHFIKQDYHYLKYYGRAHGFLAAKSTSFDDMRTSAITMLAVARETESHAKLCDSFGVSLRELVETIESPVTTAYGAYLIDVALRGDESLLMVALAACLLGYGEVGLWLQKEAKIEGSRFSLEGNPYRAWIEEYAGANYQNAVRLGIDTIEAHIAANPPSPGQYEEMLKVWKRCTKLEIGFWDMALKLS